MKVFFTAMLTILTASLAMGQATNKPLDTAMKLKIQQEIDYVGTMYGSVYAPKAWKEKHLGWDLPAQVTLAQTKLAAAKNLGEARQAMADLINSTQDYHVGFSYYSTERAVLPFQVKTVEGKSLIVFIDRKKLSAESFPYSEGDELLLVDKMPVAQIQQAIISKLGNNVALTDLALADLYMTRRSARINVMVPQGPVTLAIKRAADDSVSEVTVNWEYTPEQLVPRSVVSRPQSNLLQKMMISAKAKEFMTSPNAENLYGIGNRKSFLPDMGARIWSTDEKNTFDAYLYKNAEGHLVGVVRVFGYIVDDYQKAVTDFSGIIAHFQQHADAMIIDQNNNPGGSVFYLYALVSYLSDSALTVPRHSVALTAAEAKECLDTLDVLAPVKNDEDAAKVMKGWLSGYPETYQAAIGIRDYCNAVISEYQSGKSFSSQLHLWGLDKVTPNKVNFTKPIVLLINELDFSGGDFFPAILQDNKRVTTVGVRTAGAGGYVLEAQFPNNIGLESVSFTGSLAERIDNRPIENLGVTPDVNLSFTVSDVRNGYSKYLDEVRTILKTVIK